MAKAKTSPVSKYKTLDHIDHILTRPGRHIGSTVAELKEEWVVNADGKFVREERTIIPAFLKMFDEIIVNCVDHSMTPDGKDLTVVHVKTDQKTGRISVTDNGGIPVVKHPVDKLYIPEMIFGNLFSGSNFNENEGDETLVNKKAAGQNGEGASLVNVFSTEFKVESCDGKKACEITFSENMRKRTKIKVWDEKRVSYRGTTISWIPDYPRFNMGGLDKDHFEVIYRRCCEIAATAPHLRIKFNNRVVDGHFRNFVNRFVQDDKTEVVVEDHDPNYKIGILPSDEGFKHYSFVNCNYTKEGGPHVNDVMDSIISKIRTRIEKKAKRKGIRPLDIKNQFFLFVDCKIDLPRFEGQTKEKLMTPAREFSTRYDPSVKFINRFMKTQVVANIVEYILRKAEEDAEKEAEKFEKANAKASLNDIVKYEPPTSKDKSKWTLLLTEGDSAAKPIQSARQEYMGIYPLKGKPMNCHHSHATLPQIRKNAELDELNRILGLSLTSKNMDACRYPGGILIATDADHDGTHIRGLLFLVVARFWPDMFKRGMVKVLNTPVAKLVDKRGKVVHYSMTYEDFAADVAKIKHHEVIFLKGLGSSDDEDFNHYLSDPKFIETVEPLTREDVEALDLAFHKKRADDRKDWLGVIKTIELGDE